MVKVIPRKKQSSKRKSQTSGVTYYCMMKLPSLFMLLGVISLVSISTMIFFTRFRLIAVERRGIAGEQDYSSSSSSPFMMMLLQEEQLQSEFIRHDTNTNKNNNNKIVQKPKAKFRFGTSRLIHDDNNNNNNNNNNKDDPDTLHEVEHVNLRNAKIAKKLIEYERISEHRATRQEQALISKQQQEYETKHLAPPPPETPPIHFLTFAQLDLQDTFSATWIQRRREFMQMEMDKVIICEDAAFKAWQYRKHRLRMTADYMDLSVEHLSKWWKLLTVHKTESAYNKLMDTLQEYIRKGVQFPTPAEPLFERMIVVIAFQPYDHKDKHDEHYMLTVSNLASTIESLRRAQMGRVVVMGMNADDKEYLKDAVEYVLMNNPTLSRGVDGKSITKLGHMEVAYVQGEAAWGKTKYLERNVPRAALLGVKKAFELIDSKSLLENMTEEEHNFVVSWLGKTHQQRQPEYWKYLMLTEPDTLLQIRPTSIRHIKDQLDQGRILAPHRLQPIPHESDVPDLKNPYRFLNKDNGWNNVYELDPNNFARGTEYTDVCCDEYGGPKAKPGKANYTDCGTWWYACGFDIDYHKALEDPHKRLRPYSLMKLKQGTGLTLIAGTLMGRRCFPATSIDQCAPPLHTESPLGDGIPAEREVAQHDHTLHGPQHDHEYHATSSLSIRQVNENAQSAYSPFEDRKDYVVRRNPNTDPNPEPVFFLNFTQLALQDTFSASWFQRKKEFMEMDLEKVAICEDAAFKAWDSRRGKLRMTYDYMDLSVEHLSKWWKLLTVHNTEITFQTIMSALESYIQNGGDYTTTSSPDPLMKETLAMIAFRPYDHKHDHENHHKLTVRSLAATIESLRRTEMGRVVVMGMVQDGAATLQEALHYLINTNSGLTHEVDGQKGIVQIGHMEVAYVMGSAEYGNTKHLNENIPRATLIGLKVALLKAERSGMERTLEDENTIKAWLGNRHDPSFWKYFYLTEPDCLLHTRRASLPQLKAQLDHGHILAPHRLQPIPHESDVPGIKNKLRFLNYADGFDKVWEIDHIAEDRDVCCDEFAGPDVKPGKTDYDDCGGWWYACGFNIDYNKTRDDPHKRLRPYQVMKLKRGTGLTLIAGNLMARRCFPAKDAVCKPPYVAELSHYHG